MSHRIVLRNAEDGLTTETVLIHMGAGAADSVVANAVNNYHHYRGLLPEQRPYGMLCVSVFGVVSGVTIEDIFEALPQGQFGAASWGEVRSRFEVLPTRIEDSNMPGPIATLQRAHFDVVLPHPALPALANRDPIDLSAVDSRHLESFVGGQVRERLLPLFEPRGPKYPLSW